MTFARAGHDSYDPTTNTRLKYINADKDGFHYFSLTSPNGNLGFIADGIPSNGKYIWQVFSIGKGDFFNGTKSFSETESLISAALHGYGTVSDTQCPIEVIFR